MTLVYRMVTTLLLLAFCNLNSYGDLRFQQDIVNLGKIKSGLPLTIDFHFHNAGNEAVKILEVRGGCGCVVPAIQKRTYQPREKGRIPVQINTLGESAGPHRWYVYILYGNNSHKKPVALQLLAQVVNEVTVQPAIVNVHFRKEFECKLRLTDLRKKHLHVNGVRSTLDGLKAAIGKPIHNSSGNWETIITLRFTNDGSNFRAGPYRRETQSGYLLIDTDDVVYRRLKVPVKIKRRPQTRLTARPSRIELTGIAGADLPAKLLVVRDSNNEPVVIERIETNYAAIRCRWAKGPGKLATVRIEVDRSQLPESMIDTVIDIHIAEPAKAILKVPFRCRISTGK